MIIARELSGRSYPQIGVPEQHHPVSHHRNDPELIEKKAKIDTYHVSLLGYFAAKMQATPDGDGSLLDQSLLLYGGGMGDGNLHRHSDLPCVLLGKLGGRFKTGQHVAYPSGTPMANLLVTLLDKVGVPGRRARRQHGSPHARQFVGLALAGVGRPARGRFAERASLSSTKRRSCPEYASRFARISPAAHRVNCHERGSTSHQRPTVGLPPYIAPKKTNRYAYILEKFLAQSHVERASRRGCGDSAQG